MEEGDFLYMVEYDNDCDWSERKCHQEGVFTTPEAAWASIRETQTVSKGKARRELIRKGFYRRMTLKYRQLSRDGYLGSWCVKKLRKNTKYPRINSDGTSSDEGLEDAPDDFKREIETSSGEE